MSGIEFWVINSSRVPIFIFKLGKHDVDEHLVGSFLSVFSTFAKEIEEGSLRMLVFDKVTYYFKEYHGGDLLFVLRSPILHESLEHMLNILMELFLLHFPPELMARARTGIINIPLELEDTLQDSLGNVMLLMLEKIHGSWLDQVRNIPMSVICCRMDALTTITRAMIEGYPDETIYHYKILLKDPMLQGPLVLRTVGMVMGNELSKLLFPREITLTPREILRLLDPLTVCKYDSTNKEFKIEICPFCRGLSPSQDGRGRCQIVEGIIQGALASPHVKVKEVSCIANKDRTCTFRVIREPS